MLLGGGSWGLLVMRMKGLDESGEVEEGCGESGWFRG